MDKDLVAAARAGVESSGVGIKGTGYRFGGSVKGKRGPGTRKMQWADTQSVTSRGLGDARPRRGPGGPGEWSEPGHLVQPTGRGRRPKRSSLLSVTPGGLSVYYIISCVRVCIGGEK